MKKKGRCFYQWLLLKTWPQYKTQEAVLSVNLIICPDGLFIVARVLLQELDILVSELLLDTADPHGRAAELWLNIWCWLTGWIAPTATADIADVRHDSAGAQLTPAAPCR